MLLSILSMNSCNDTSQEEEVITETGEEQEHAEVKEAMLTQNQFEALGMEIDTLKQRTMSGYVEANGELEVPPQNEASVTAVLGANVSEIMVIEGEQVREDQILAYITHPDIIDVQTDFLNAANQLNFQEKEFKRHQKLYEAGVGSGESFQRAEAAYKSAQGLVNGLKAQLRLLNLNPEVILKGNIYQRIPVLSPISGAISEVNVKTGQFVQPQKSMFEIVNTDHVHADLMVFEEDVSEIEVGQEVNLSVGSSPGIKLKASILSISKTFEEDPKAVHVHAEIENKPENLIPGMYVRGRINVDNSETTALPESAINRDGETFFVFKAEPEGEAWSFKPVEVITGTSDGDWVEVNFLSPVEPGSKFAYNNAYYLMAQMNKGEAGHSH
ncbi:MAG TPA: efflux RND transporter periplasmic adaptor subunit [Salinimicrobium sp.]|nr:efflux RND transporter periplasmic adaptor subunit [Salinimicrobium sp.]